MTWMECYVIHWKYILCLASLCHIGSVALKSEVVFCSEHGNSSGALTHNMGPQAYIRVGWVDVLDCHTPFYGSQSKACWLVLLVSEYTNTSVLVLQWTLYPLKREPGHAHIS